MQVPRIFDQTLRDGLGSYPPVQPEVKAELARRLLAAGIDYLEVVRFPRQETYPQFQDARAILESVQPYRDRAVIAAFAMRQEGIDEALGYAELFDEIHIPSFASDAYGRFALGEDWQATLRRIEGGFKAFEAKGVRLTVGLGASYGCPIDRSHAPAVTASKVRDVVSIGVRTVMIGDTAGQATPSIVRQVLTDIWSGLAPEVLRVHFHDTFGRGLVNTWEAVRLGARGVDTSILGLGGEPYPYFLAPELINNGNCATEELVSLLADELSDTGQYRPDIFNDTARWLFEHVEGTVFGRAAFAELVPLPVTEGEAAQTATNRH